MNIFEPLTDRDYASVSDWLYEARQEMSEIAVCKSSIYSYNFEDDSAIFDKGSRFQWEHEPASMKAKDPRERFSFMSIGRSSISTLATLETEPTEDIPTIQPLEWQFSNVSLSRESSTRSESKKNRGKARIEFEQECPF